MQKYKIYILFPLHEVLFVFLLNASLLLIKKKLTLQRFMSYLKS
jgi:hypothetical protein